MKDYTYSRNVRYQMKHRNPFSFRKALRRVGTAIGKFFLMMIVAAAILLMFWYGWGKECEYQEARLADFREIERRNNDDYWK